MVNAPNDRKYIAKMSDQAAVQFFDVCRRIGKALRGLFAAECTQQRSPGAITEIGPQKIGFLSSQNDQAVLFVLCLLYLYLVYHFQPSYKVSWSLRPLFPSTVPGFSCRA
jgi:hypothetical protein